MSDEPQNQEAGEKRDDKGRLLPGNNLNPGGRPKAIKEALEAFRDEGDLKKLRDRLMSIAMDEDKKAACAAIKEWHDRAYGKAPQAITDAEGKGFSIGVVLLPSDDK